MEDTTMEKRLIRTIEKFNRELAEYIKVSGDDELPDIDSTCIGFSPVDYYEINGDEVTDCDGNTYDTTDWCSLEELKEALKYDRRRLSKAWRIWNSENPDAELEKDDENE